MNRARSASIEEYILQEWSFAPGEDEDVADIAAVVRT